MPAPPMRVIGFWGASALVAGNMIGSGLLLTPAALAPYGGWALLGWCVTSFGALCLALVFVRLNLQLKKSGGPHVYVKEMFGDFVGFQMAWSYWLFSWSSNGALAVGTVSYLVNFFPELLTTPGLALSVELGLVWSFTVLNCLSIGAASRLQIVLTFLKIFPLLLFAVMAMGYGNLGTLLRPAAEGISGFQALNATVALTLWAFIGVESATIPSKAVQDPARTISLATITGVVVAAVVYVVGTVALMSILPIHVLEHSSAPYVDAAQFLWGEKAGGIMAALGTFAIAGTLNGWILLQGQIPLSMAQENFFPRFFGKLSSRGTPMKGILLGSILLSLLLVINFQKPLTEQFRWITLLSTFTIVVPYLFSTVAAGMLTKRQNHLCERQKMWRMLPVTGALLYCLWAVVGSSSEVVVSGFLLLLLCVPLYLWVKVSTKMKSQ